MKTPGGSTRIESGFSRIAAALLLLLGTIAHAGPVELVVTNPDDAGAGSLRAALDAARAEPEQNFRITFGDREGPFSTPQTIVLSAPLPPIEGHVTIDGFIDQLLWKAYGATISGNEQHSIFEVMPEATLRLTGVTLRDGFGENGGAIVNHGRLIVEGVSLFDNRALGQGGAIINFGQAEIINSTFAGNQAEIGGGLANPGGSMRLVNSTVHDNLADRGAAIWNAAELLLVNSILSGQAPQQCFNAGALDPASTHNLIQGIHRDCGEPLLTGDPEVQKAGYYNGPTPTMPIDGASPALNMGNPEAARDASGERLKWDQRGNGDPRFAGGYTDLGAFERQSQLPDEFVVDTLEDNGLRGCTRVGTANCPLRAAIELAAAARNPTPVRFKNDLFREATTLVLTEMPEGSDMPIVIDGEGAAPVNIVTPVDSVPWRAINGVTIETGGQIGETATPGRPR